MRSLWDFFLSFFFFPTQTFYTCSLEKSPRTKTKWKHPVDIKSLLWPCCPPPHNSAPLPTTLPLGLCFLAVLKLLSASGFPELPFVFPFLTFPSVPQCALEAGGTQRRACQPVHVASLSPWHCIAECWRRTPQAQVRGSALGRSTGGSWKHTDPAGLLATNSTARWT